jgi:osmotically-inducible protein OsmY
MMHGNRIVAVLVAIAIGFAVAPSPARAAQSDPGMTAAKPDNTRINKRDRNAVEMTADKQGASKQDREITRQIRRALVRDKGLSFYAHNVKVITKGGLVTLKGPVKSEQERQAVLKAATAAGGARDITDEMSVTR